MEKIVTVLADKNYSRLDLFLVEHFGEYSRSYFRGLITNGDVQVNEQVVYKPSSKVHEGYQVELQLRVDTLEYNLEPRKVDFGVVYTHPDFLIIDKPHDLMVHHSNSSPNAKTLTAGLLHNFKEFDEFEDKERPGIVHRLDRHTSGLMIVARNMLSRMALSEMFKAREVSKTYLAVVKGHPPKEGKMDYPVGRHRTDRHKMSHVGLNSKPALTYYKVLAYYKDAALVEVKIITGRTHQIRVHFAAIGHGLLGDSVYGVTSKLMARQALHSWKLSFSYGGDEYKFVRRVPDDFCRLLQSLTASL